MMKETTQDKQFSTEETPSEFIFSLMLTCSKCKDDVLDDAVMIPSMVAVIITIITKTKDCNISDLY